MNVKDSYEYHCHFDEKDYVCFTDGSPNIHKDVVTPIAQQIHDLLVGKGLTYTGIKQAIIEPLPSHLLIDKF